MVGSLSTNSGFPRRFMNGPRIMLSVYLLKCIKESILSGCNFIRVAYDFGVCSEGFPISGYQGYTISLGWRVHLFT